MMEPHAERKNRMSDRWRRLEYEIFKNNFILTWNHGFIADKGTFPLVT